jgi:glycerophosphoryl diester phosphodiesterase
MKPFLLQFFGLMICHSAFSQSSPSQKLNNVFNSKDKGILVTAHRGDWRNTAENSVQALKNCIAMGADIMELDLKKTKDGQLIIMHDQTIDRTTTGKGEPSNYTLEEIKAFYLRSGVGHQTRHHIPTFKEILAAAKNNILIDVDKGYDYFPQVVKELRETGMIDQAVINVKNHTPLSTIETEQGPIPEDVTLMLIVDMKKPDASSIIDSYKAHKRTIIQTNFNTDTLSILKDLGNLRQHYGLWINSLWPEQNGGHDDDRAVEDNQPDQSWGWLIEHRANMIQTDRPKELLQYLKNKKLHP